MGFPDLGRFVDAQAGAYASALAELRQGAKTGHWIWFIFPQIVGLGQSATSRHYAIGSLAEAGAYLAHPILGARLAECTDAMLGWAGQRSAATILGFLDAMKFISSMTLFEAAGGDARHGRAIDAFAAGRRDAATLNRLSRIRDS